MKLVLFLILIIGGSFASATPTTREAKLLKEAKLVEEAKKFEIAFLADPRSGLWEVNAEGKTVPRATNAFEVYTTKLNEILLQTHFAGTTVDYILHVMKFALSSEPNIRMVGGSTSLSFQRQLGKVDEGTRFFCIERLDEELRKYLKNPSDAESEVMIRELGRFFITTLYRPGDPRTRDIVLQLFESPITADTFSWLKHDYDERSLTYENGISFREAVENKDPKISEVLSRRELKEQLIVLREAAANRTLSRISDDPIDSIWATSAVEKGLRSHDLELTSLSLSVVTTVIETDTPRFLSRTMLSLAFYPEPIISSELAPQFKKFKATLVEHRPLTRDYEGELRLTFMNQQQSFIERLKKENKPLRFWGRGQLHGFLALDSSVYDAALLRRTTETLEAVEATGTSLADYSDQIEALHNLAKTRHLGELEARLSFLLIGHSRMDCTALIKGLVN